MRFLCILAVVGSGIASAAVAPIDLDKPESLFLAKVKAFRANDATGFLQALPAESRQQLEADWAAFKVTALSPQHKAERESFDKFLTQCTAPNAIDVLMQGLEPGIKAMNPQEVSQNLMMIGTFAPMMFGNRDAAGKETTGTPDPVMVKTGAFVQGLCTDAAAWVPGAQLNDPVKARSALTSVLAGIDQFKVHNTEELVNLPLAEVAKRMGPLIAAGKRAALVYGLNADAVLDTVKATSSGSGDQRVMTISFTSFGHQRDLQVHMQRVKSLWQADTTPFQAIFTPAVTAVGGGGDGAAQVTPGPKNATH